MAGLTSNGFTIPTIQDLLDEMKAEADSLSGRDVSFSEDTPLGVQVTILASQLEKLWALAQAVYDSKNKAKAEGTSLDDLAAWLNITREAETNSNGYVTFLGDVGTVIPVSTQIQDPNSTLVCTTDSASTLDNASCNGVILTLNSLVVGNVYTVTINTVQYSYTAVSGDTTTSVLTNLANAITLATVTKTVSSDSLRIQGTASVTNLSVSINPNLLISKVLTSVQVTLTTSGATYVAANTMTKLVTGISGIDSVVNREDFTTGEAEESDESLRLRIGKEVSQGKATPDAIIDNIKNRVDGVTDVIIVENLTNTTDGEGRPANSYETYVDGGDSQSIADVIWDTKPSGIQTYGANTYAVTDANNTTQYVKFSRLEAVNLYVRVTYTTYTEETVPSTIADSIKTIVAENVNALTRGVDFIPQRLFGPIFSGVAGLATLVVESSLNGTTWSSSVRSISSYQVARTTESNVSVVAS